MSSLILIDAGGTISSIEGPGGALTGRWFVEVDGNPPSRRRDPTPTRTTAWATAHTWPASSARCR